MNKKLGLTVLLLLIFTFGFTAFGQNSNSSTMEDSGSMQGNMMGHMKGHHRRHHRRHRRHHRHGMGKMKMEGKESKQ